MDSTRSFPIFSLMDDQEKLGNWKILEEDGW